ncbi:TIGR02269 family lipoprotein [Myxococcus sp. AM011]|nr:MULTISPECIES: TIGR02269 family lipoprotein [Myxococcus]NVJ21205.1 TIGR02269 family lipoprotein [Myxococcus sp. AM011]
MVTIRAWWVALLWAVLLGCSTTSEIASTETITLPREADSAEDCAGAADNDTGCVTIACAGNVCGGYRCEDVASAPVALRGATAPSMTGASSSPQRLWGAPQVLPGREAVFVIRWERPEELPSQKQIRKAYEEWEKVPKEKHHIFPRAFESYFAQQGINIHEYAIAIDVKRHKEIHRGESGAPWNADWEDHILRLEGASLSPRDAKRRHFEHAGYMIQKYRLVGMPMSYWQQLGKLEQVLQGVSR